MALFASPACLPACPLFELPGAIRANALEHAEGGDVACAGDGNAWHFSCAFRAGKSATPHPCLCHACSMADALNSASHFKCDCQAIFCILLNIRGLAIGISASDKREPTDSAKDSTNLEKIHNAYNQYIANMFSLKSHLKICAQHLKCDILATVGGISCPATSLNQ